MSMSSRQCFGGGGSSSGASVSLISRPHTLHRYLTLTLRSSPAGGGGGIGGVRLLSRPMPLFHRRRASARPTSTHTIAERAGITLSIPVRFCRPRSGRDGIVCGDPADRLGRIDAAFSHLVEDGAH